MLPHTTQVYVTIIIVILIQLQTPACDGKDFSGPNVKSQILTKIPIPYPQTCGVSKFSCGVGASCVNGVCQCGPSTSGDARLACLASNDYRTAVTGDPVVTAYDGSKAHVSFSCRTMCTDVKSRHKIGSRGGRCRTKIYTILHREPDGYYVLAVDLELLVKDKEHPRATGKVAFRIFGYEEDGEAAYKEQHHYTTTFSDGKHYAALPYLTEMVRTSYNKEENLVTVGVPACGINAHFRAHVKYSHQFPGLAISVSKQNLPKFPTTNHPISGTPHTSGQDEYIREKHRLHLSKEQLILFRSLKQDAIQDFGIYGLGCTIANKMFNGVCSDDASKALAVAKCSGFYTNATTLKCIESGEFGASSSSMFALCTQALCLNHHSLCNDVKNEMQLLGCEPHTELQEFDCSKIGTALEKYEDMVKTKNPAKKDFFQESIYNFN